MDTSDKLLKCALSYKKITENNYKIILGHKNKIYNINVKFEPVIFHHLVGLHKLTDLRIARNNREKVYYNILDGKLSYNDVLKSSYIDLIEERLNYVQDLEKIFDSNELIFRYNEKMNPFSKIKAEYLMSTPLGNKEIYVFLDKIDKCEDDYFCRSFFPKENIDYTKNQSKMTMLYKEKINVATGDKTVQFDKLTPKN